MKWEQRIEERKSKTLQKEIISLKKLLADYKNKLGGFEKYVQDYSSKKEIYK